MTVTPENPYFHQQWNLRAIRAPQAWGELKKKSTDLIFGSSEIIIAVVDTGVQTAHNLTDPPVVAGQVVVPTHTAFRGNVRGNPQRPKAAGFVRLSIVDKDDNDEIVGAHGTEVAGVIVASAKFSAENYASDSAIVGVAPNCRFLGVSFAAGNSLVKDFVYWAANMGLDYATPANFSRSVTVPPTAAADIVNFSFRDPDSHSLFPFNMAFDCTVFGRRGRGITIIQGAGNDGDKPLEGAIPDAYSDRITLVGATMVADDDKGTHDVFDTETYAPYSDFGPRLDICAPAGGQKGEVGADQQQTYTTVPRDCGTFDLNSTNVWELTIQKQTPTTYAILSVQKPVAHSQIGIFPGQFIAIGDPSADTYEMRRIVSATHGPSSVITIDRQFHNLTGMLNLSNVKATVAFQFTTLAAPSGSGLDVTSATGFRGGQAIYVFDAAHFAFATITSVSGNTFQLASSLAGPGFAAGAVVVASGQTFNITGVHVPPSGAPKSQSTAIDVAGDGFFVGQLVHVSSSDVNAMTQDGFTEITEVTTDPVTHAVSVSLFGDYLYLANHSNRKMETLGGGEYTSEFDGTSAAAPCVAGGAALVLSANTDLNWVEVRHLLRETAYKPDLEKGGWQDENGGGLFTGFFPTFAESAPEIALTAAAAQGTSTIQVSDPANLANEVVVRISGLLLRDFAVVAEVTGNVVTLDRPLSRGYGAGDTVKIGGKAHRHKRFGRGRIDLERAVIAAKAWDVNARDLWIRASPDDLTGSRPVDPAMLDSPDIWVRTVAPAADGANAIPVGNDPGPHQLPMSGQPAWVYVRISNRGTKPSLDGMEIVLTYTETRDPANPISFHFPDRWQPRRRLLGAAVIERTVMLTPVEGKLIVDPNYSIDVGKGGVPYATDPSIAPLFGKNGSVLAVPGYDFKKPYVIPPIPPGQSHIAIFPWRKEDIPTVPIGRGFVKVHITPFDGDDSVAGLDVHTNNNLAVKEIFFRGVTLVDGGKNELSLVRVMPSTQIVQFSLEIRQIPVTAANQIDITATATMADGTTAPPQTFTNSTGAANGWSFAGGAPSWLTLIQPVASGGISAAGLQALTVFTGNLIVDNTFAKVEFRVVVKDGANAVIDRTLTVAIKAELPKNAHAVSGFDDVVFRTFADWDLLPAQSGTDNYGPLASDQFTRYRTAAMFSGIAPGGTQLKAFAVTSGHAFIQEIAGSGTQVNLILRPEAQINTPYGAVKCFVYRGLLKSSFLEPNGDVKADQPSTNNELLNRYWVVRASLNAEEKQLDSSFTDLPLKRDDLGLTTAPDPPLPDGMPISELFDRFNRFPRITRGMWIGDFATASAYGFEIAVDGPAPESTLADVRTLDHTIDVTYSGGQPQFANGAEDDVATKLQREQILGYIDPVAFLGLIAGGHIERSTSSGFTTISSIADINDKILTKFATRDTVYLDIRNELNLSLNVFGNYGDGTALNTAQFQFKDAGGTLVPRSYETFGWPIAILHAADFAANATDDKVPIRLTLPVGDNADPLVYLAGAAFHLDFPDYARKFDIVTAPLGPAAQTSEFDLGIYNDKTKSVVLPAALKIVYARRYQSSTNPVFPARRILKDDLIDTLLSPNASSVAAPPAGMTAWNTVGELRYNGWTSHNGFDFTLKSGRAIDDVGEVVFAYVHGPAEVHGGTSQGAAHASIDQDKGRDKARSFYEHLQRAGLAFIGTVPTNTGPPVPALRVQSVHDNFSINVFEKSADDLISIAYTTPEATSIRSAASAANFLASAPAYFMALNHLMAVDGDQFPYFMMDLGLEGIVYNSISSTYAVIQVNTEIKVYSFDGRNYFSAAYTNAVLPMLPFPS
jgi:hypothetical protein